MDHSIKAGVVGAGKMGANHARVYHALPGFSLVGLMDTDPRVAEGQADHIGCRAFRSLREMQEAGIEAVTVAAPTTAHADLVVEAFQRGLHVLVEKPIAATLEEAERMIKAGEAAGRTLMVGHIERFNPAVEAIKGTVRPEDIISINVIRVGPRPPRIKDAGVIIDMAVHDIDLVHHLVEQPVEEVYCVTSSNLDLYEDTASILLKMRGGAGAQLTANWITPYKAREIQVITAERLIRGNLLTQQVQVFSRFAPDELSYIVRDVFVRHGEPLQRELEAFGAAIRGEEPALITGWDGYRVLDVAIRASAYKQNAAVRAA